MKLGTDLKPENQNLRHRNRPALPGFSFSRLERNGIAGGAMKKLVLLLVIAGLVFVAALAVTIGVADSRNRRDPAGRFVTENPPSPTAGVVAAEYQSLGLLRKTRSWTLNHTPEQLRAWLASADFERADQRLAVVRQKLEPDARPPFKDKKYVAAYARPSEAGTFLLVMDGNQRSCYVVVDRSLPGSLGELFGGAGPPK